MYKFNYLLLSLCICGCEPQSDYPYTYGYSYDHKDEETNVRVQYQASVTHYPFQNILNEWAWVQACTGLSTLNGPLIVIVDDMPQYTGFSWFDENAIAIEEHNLGKNNVLKHEFIHHLLDENGYNTYDNANHLSYLFEQCSPGVNY